MAKYKTYDETITKQVRNEALQDILAVLQEKKEVERFSEFKKQMLLKLANTVLPRVTELSGPDGKPIPITGVEIVARR